MQNSIRCLKTHNVNRCGRSRQLERKFSLRRKRCSPNDVELAVMESGNRVVGRLLCWGRPKNWELTADVEEYVAKGETKSQSVYLMRFGEILEISMPDTSGTTGVGFGDTFTKEKFQIVLGQNND